MCSRCRAKGANVPRSLLHVHVAESDETSGSGGGVTRLSHGLGQQTGQVVCLAVSPFCPDAFLAVHQHGLIAIHSTKQSHALMCWEHVSHAPLVAARYAVREHLGMQMFWLIFEV